MPTLGDDDDLQQIKTTSQYGFSATRLDALLASEYTLVSIIVDGSGSVRSFWDEIKKCIKKIVESCSKSPKADNLLLRLVTFDSDLQEIHGFKLLENCNLTDYDNIPCPGGTTALYDAAENAIDATLVYGRSIIQDNHCDCNAIVFVLTDGCDSGRSGGSSSTINDVKKVIEKASNQEMVESLISILIGVNVANQHVKDELDEFNKDAGFTQFEVMEKADAKHLARLADFISQSISSQSQAVKSGGPSQAIGNLVI